KIRVLNRSIFKGLGAECSALEDAAAAHELRANRGVHPRIGSQIKSITQNKALARALADIRNQKTSCPHFAARGSCGVRKPDQGHRIGPPLDLYGSPNVVKEAVTRADVVVSFVGFEMLVAVVKLNVPGRRGFVGFSVVFDVVSAKAGVPVMDVHVAVGSCDIAFAAL